MSTETDEPEHLDVHADPPTVDGPSQIRAVANYCLGNRIFVHAIERLPDGDYLAYLGVSEPYDTSAAADSRELSFVNYAPVGSVRAVACSDGDYYEVHMPDREVLGDAIRARKRYEAKHRSALVPGLTNTLADREQLHHEEYSQYEAGEDPEDLSELDLTLEEMHDYAFNKGMERMANLLQRRVSGHLDGPYRGNRRWSKHDTGSVLGEDHD